MEIVDQASVAPLGGGAPDATVDDTMAPAAWLIPQAQVYTQS